MDKIVEAFGKYMAEIDGVIVTFEDRVTAETAVAMSAGKEEMTEKAAAYCASRKLEGKNAKAKTRIVIDFMAFLASPAEGTEEA